MKNHLWAVLAILAAGACAMPRALADTISLTTAATACTQNFDTLASSGTSSTVPTGWAFSESLGSANTIYTAGIGDSNSGDTYSFGTASSTERAFGGLQSSTLDPKVGAGFANNTGSTITALVIRYTGEQWCIGTKNRIDRLDFQYSLDATSLVTGTWPNFDSLDFTAPNTTAALGALDGNAATNRTAKSATIKGLTIARGATFYIRWGDFNASGTDDGLGVDDFSLTPLVTSGANIPARFGPGAQLATQTRPTNYGDNLSEPNQLFGTSDGGNVRLGITGNLQANGNGIIILLDTKGGGTNPMNYAGLSNGLRISGLNGDTLDSGFIPDYAIDSSNDGGTLYADLHDLQAGTMTPLGGAAHGTGAAGLSGGGEMAFNNSNTSGVTGTDPANAATATTGLEISLPLTRIGSPTGAIKIMVLLTDPLGNVSNQVLPGLPDTYGNLGTGDQNYATIPGRQYVTMTPAFTANDLALSQLPWTYEARAFTGDGTRDNHPPVVNPPTIYNGRAYLVEDVEHFGGAHTGSLVAVSTADGTVDTAFGTSGRVALSGPATGRVAVRSIGGVVRLFLATTNGDLYSMDAADGSNLHTLALGGSTSSTPAVVPNGSTATIYVPVESAGVWSMKKVTDSTSMSTAGTLTLAGVTSITSSPSLIADGTRVQIGCATATGGVVYTISSDLSTVFTGAVTTNPVKAPPTLSSDSARFYVGDAPASGNGSFYCFDASTGSQLLTRSIIGGLEYAAFGDYSLGNITNALYFATSTGQLNAVNPDTLNPLPGYPATPLGVIPATGAVALLNGNLYLPTVKGMYVVPSAVPTTYTRFPMEAQASTPSSTGRAAGGVMATTGATGLVNGLTVQ